MLFPIAQQMQFPSLVALFLATSLSSVHGHGVLVDPAPRPITSDYRRNLPPTLKDLPDRDLHRLPNDFVRKRYGNDSAKKFRDVSGPCNGVPPAPDRSLRATRGGRPVKFSWDVANADASNQCKLSLICPSRSADRILWSGNCRDARQYSQEVQIPPDVSNSGPGECFIQWSLDTKTDRFCNCVDIIIDSGSTTTTGSSVSSTIMSSVGMSSTSVTSSSAISTIITTSSITTSATPSLSSSTAHFTSKIISVSSTLLPTTSNATKPQTATSASSSVSPTQTTLIGSSSYASTTSTASNASSTSTSTLPLSTVSLSLSEKIGTDTSTTSCESSMSKETSSVSSSTEKSKPTIVISEKLCSLNF
jgi:hypothetical protein